MSNKQLDRWLKIAGLIGFLFGIGSCYIGASGFFANRAWSHAQQDLEVQRLEAETWDLLGGVDGVPSQGTDRIDALSVQEDSLMERAKRNIQMMLSIDDRSARTHRILGVYFTKRRMYLQALDEFKRALEIDPDYKNVYLSIGNVQVALGRFDDAVTSYSEAISANPCHGMARRNRGTVLFRLGQVDAAIRDLEVALLIDPEDLDARSKLTMVLTVSDRVRELEGIVERLRHASAACAGHLLSTIVLDGDPR